MRSLQNLYRLQQKNMRKNKLNIVQLCPAKNRALHCSIFKGRWTNILKVHAWGGEKYSTWQSLLNLVITENFTGIPQVVIEIFWSVPTNLGDPKMLSLHFYPVKSFLKTASLWARDVILTLLQRLYHVATSYRRCNNTKITSCANRVW